jgi:hypothetical protein
MCPCAWIDGQTLEDGLLQVKTPGLLANTTGKPKSAIAKKKTSSVSIGHLASRLFAEYEHKNTWRTIDTQWLFAECQHSAPTIYSSSVFVQHSMSTCLPCVYQGHSTKF